MKLIIQSNFGGSTCKGLHRCVYKAQISIDLTFDLPMFPVWTNLPSQHPSLRDSGWCHFKFQLKVSRHCRALYCNFDKTIYKSPHVRIPQGYKSYLKIWTRHSSDQIRPDIHRCFKLWFNGHRNSTECSWIVPVVYQKLRITCHIVNWEQFWSFNLHSR